MSRADSELWRAKLSHAFAGFDVNGNGYITNEDLDAHKARVAEAFGYTSDSPEYAEFAAAEDAFGGTMVSRLDKSGDDQISLEEWLQFWGEASDADIADWTDKHAAAVVSLAASDDGLTKEEYAKFAFAASAASEDEAQAAFDALDTDGSGFISKDEFARFQIEFTTATEDATGNALFGAAT